MRGDICVQEVMSGGKLAHDRFVTQPPEFHIMPTFLNWQAFDIAKIDDAANQDFFDKP
jgi:hypothetical protein